MYLILTSDGVTHIASEERAVEILDRYGPEVISVKEPTDFKCIVCKDDGCEHCPKT